MNTILDILTAHDGWSQVGPRGGPEMFDLICHGCGRVLCPAIPDGFGEDRMDELQRQHVADIVEEFYVRRAQA